MSATTPDDDEPTTTTVPGGPVLPSISIRMIRHAESFNNQVYRNARYIYRGGTPEYDEAGWNHYVETHRSADPGLSDIGQRQADKLAAFLVPHLQNQASAPVSIITSPMKRTLQTIRPTCHGLDESQYQMLIHGFYFESEGCHTKDKPEEGMNPDEIRQFLKEKEGAADGEDSNNNDTSNMSFVGFPDAHRGWYCDGTGPETREASEVRAAKFYLWLSEYLDEQLMMSANASTNTNNDQATDIFDAGVAIQGEESENELDKHAARLRRRRTCLLIGHGDFMSLVLKRVIAGYGHSVETTGAPHRSAFVHYNTGMTELEYFGQGRWLLMQHNQTPHLLQGDTALCSGGSLKDGWSYLMPNVLDAEVAVAFEDDEVELHIKEQAQALKALYLSSDDSDKLFLQQPHDDRNSENNADGNINGNNSNNNLSIGYDYDSDETSASKEQQQQQQGQEATGGMDDNDNNSNNTVKHFYVKRGQQVVGVASYDASTSRLYDVAVRPSASKQAISQILLQTAQDHARRKFGRAQSFHVMTRSTSTQQILQEMGFVEDAAG